MNIENQNDQEEFEEDTVLESQIQEAMELAGVDENLNPTNESEEEESDDDTGNEDPAVEEDTDDTSGESDKGEADDDAITGEADDDGSSDDEDADKAFRQQFAEFHGIGEDAISELSVAQLQRIGEELDRVKINQLQQEQQNHVPQQQLDPFQQMQMPQVPQVPQQQFALQPQQGGFDINQLRTQAEENGWDENLVNQMEQMHQQNLYWQQQQMMAEQQRQMQIQQESIARENAFDESISRLGMPELFGTDKQSAFANGIQFESRKHLYQMAGKFSEATGQPMSDELINRVARVVFAQQFKQKEKNDLIKKATKQSKKKLGSSSTRTGALKKRNDEMLSDDPEVDEILEDPEILALADKFSIPRV